MTINDDTGTDENNVSTSRFTIVMNSMDSLPSVPVGIYDTHEQASAALARMDFAALGGEWEVSVEQIQSIEDFSKEYEIPLVDDETARAQQETMYAPVNIEITDDMFARIQAEQDEITEQFEAFEKGMEGIFDRFDDSSDGQEVVTALFEVLSGKTQLGDDLKKTDEEDITRQEKDWREVAAFGTAGLALGGHEVTNPVLREITDRHARQEITTEEAIAAVRKHTQG